MKKEIKIESNEQRNAIGQSMKGKHNNPEWKLRNSGQPAVKVRCIELRCVFDSVYAAAKMINTTKPKTSPIIYNF